MRLNFSHVNASFGSWRPALQSLRSFIENTLSAIYYLDHPVEYIKWESGTFRLTPRELREYVVDHPKTSIICKELGLRAELDKEYATLSKAVHGSTSMFRMTSIDGNTKIADASIPELGKWSKREQSAFNLCLVLLVAVLQEHFDGAKQEGLRNRLGVALKVGSRAALKQKLGISIPAP